MVVSADRAKVFAQAWIDAWNRRDVDAVMSYYAENTEFSSPFVAELAGEPSCLLRGKLALRSFWEKTLAMVPHFQLELLHAFGCVDGICLVYRGLYDLVEAETMVFDANGQVAQTRYHFYRSREGRPPAV